MAIRDLIASSSASDVLKQLIFKLLARRGLVLMKYDEIKELLALRLRSQGDTTQIPAMQGEDERISFLAAEKITQSCARLQSIADEQAKLIADMQDRNLSQVRALQAANVRLRAIANQKKPETQSRQRTVVVIIVTAASQLNLLYLLLDETSFLKTYRPIVVTYIDSKLTGLALECQKRSLSLLDQELEFIHSAGDAFNKYVWQENYRSKGSLAHSNRYPYWVALKRNESVDVKSIGDEIIFLNELRNGFVRALRELGTSLALMFEDNAESETGIWVAAANLLGIPSVIIPFTIADAIEPAESHHPDPLFHVSDNKYNELAAELFPDSIVRHRERDLIRRPGVAVIASEWLGMAPPLPWILNSTFGDAIAVESPAMMEHYQRIGIPAEKLRLIGSLSDDVLFKAVARQDEARRELGIAPQDRIVVCAFPPNQLSALRPQCEFSDYDELMRFWLTQLASRDGWRVIVRPHPFMGEADLAALRNCGAIVSLAHTAALIPLCDFYVASVSSTIRWAIAMAKPVLNYDVFAYGYRDFDHVGSIVKAHTREQFSRSCGRMFSDDRYMASLKSLAREEAENWGMVDGKSGERLLRLLQELVSGTGPEAPNSGVALTPAANAPLRS